MAIFCSVQVDTVVEHPISATDEALFEHAWQQSLADEKQEQVRMLLLHIVSDYQLAYEQSTNNLSMRIPEDEHPERLRQDLKNGKTSALLQAATGIQIRTQLLLGRDEDIYADFWDRHRNIQNTVTAPTFTRLQDKMTELRLAQTKGL